MYILFQSFYFLFEQFILQLLRKSCCKNKDHFIFFNLHGYTIKRFGSNFGVHVKCSMPILNNFFCLKLILFCLKLILNNFSLMNLVYE